MSLTAAAKAEIVKEYQKDAKDTGSPEVQIALLTVRIKTLTEHFKTHTHDHNSRRGLMRVVNQRRKLLVYLQRVDSGRHRAVIEKLGLRG